jgi:hypothetical protein
MYHKDEGDKEDQDMRELEAQEEFIVANSGRLEEHEYDERNKAWTEVQGIEQLELRTGASNGSYSTKNHQFGIKLS